MAIKRNEVVFNSQPQPQPQNENKLAKFLASIGKFVETPEGQQTATNLASAIPLLFGRSDIASGIVGAGQQAYDRQMQEQKAQQDQAFRNLQMQLAQSQQNIENQRQNREFGYKQEQDAKKLAIDQGKLNLGIETLNSKNKQNAIANELARDKLKNDNQYKQSMLEQAIAKNQWERQNQGQVVRTVTGANIPAGYIQVDSKMANIVPSSLIERANNGDVYVNSSELPKHHVNTLLYDENGRPQEQVVYTNTPEQAQKLNTATTETKLLINLIDEASVAREEYGRETIAGDKTIRAKYESLDAQMKLRIKNIYGLGVISDSDYQFFLNKMVPNLNAFLDSGVFSKLNELRSTAINTLDVHKDAYVYDPAKDPLNQYAIQSQSQSQSNFSPVVLQSGAKIIGVE